jgi:glycine oxidase
MKNKVRFETNVGINQINLQNDSVDLIFSTETTPVNHVNGRHLMITAGAWCNSLLTLIGMKGPFVPVKGQISVIPKFYEGNFMMHWNKNLYMVPRGNVLLAGSTTEPHIWDEEPVPAESENLQRLLKLRFPGIDTQPLDEWAGIRPRTKDRLPLMGTIDKAGLISICSGHYKSGIMMAPLSAKCMSALINGDSSPLPPESFDPHRKKGVK